MTWVNESRKTISGIYFEYTQNGSVCWASSAQMRLPIFRKLMFISHHNVSILKKKIGFIYEENHKFSADDKM